MLKYELSFVWSRRESLFVLNEHSYIVSYLYIALFVEEESRSPSVERLHHV